MTPSPDILLWNPARRAYLSAGGHGYTRRLSRAAVMTPAQADAVRGEGFGGLMPEPTCSPSSVPPVAPAVGLSDDELLRRAVRALAAPRTGPAPRWAVVMDTLGLTSAGAVQLCKRLNLNPIERMGM